MIKILFNEKIVCLLLTESLHATIRLIQIQYSIRVFGIREILRVYKILYVMYLQGNHPT